MNWSLFLFVIIAAAIAFLVQWVANGSKFDPKKEAMYYGLSVLVCGVIAYFINEPVTQKIILMALTIAFPFLFKAIMKLSNK